MTCDNSGKIRIVESEMMRFDECEDVHPVFFHIVPPGLIDGMQFERDHGLDPGSGDGLSLRLGTLKREKHIVVNQHEIDRRQREFLWSLILVKIRRFGEQPVL